MPLYNLTHVVERLCEELCPAAMSDIAIDRMLLEKLLLFTASILKREVVHDILLTPVDDAHEAEFERVCPASQDIQSIRSGIHQVKLGQNSQGAQSAGVDRTRKFEGVRIGQVYVRWRYCENDTKKSGKSQGYSTHAFGLEM